MFILTSRTNLLNTRIFLYCYCYRSQRSCGQGYVFIRVCDSVNRGGLPEGNTPPPRRRPLWKENPLEGDPPWKEATPQKEAPPKKEAHPKKEAPPPGPHPRGKLRGIRSRPTPKGEIEGDQIQAHTQGGNWGGIRSRPAPKGEIEGDLIQAPSHPPPKKQTLAYGQWAAGTHLTGMHSCCLLLWHPGLICSPEHFFGFHNLASVVLGPEIKYIK